MKIAIIGAGAIGRLFAWFLARGGAKPILIVRRQAQLEAFRQQGVTVVDLHGETHHLAVESLLGAEQLPPDIDGVLITVKSYDTKKVAERLRHHLPPDVPVLSLQNGLGNGEQLAMQLPAEHLALGLTTYGATAEGETKVYLRGEGLTTLGDWVEQREKGVLDPAIWWQKCLVPSGHRTSLATDIRTEVWRKAMVNIGINPLTALFQLRNGELVLDETLLLFMKKTVAEAEQVAKAEGVPLQDSFSKVLEVCRLTSANVSSMLQDRQKNRPTEIDSLCGVIVALGDKHQIPTPCNRVLMELLHSKLKWTKKDLLYKIDMLC